jgi:hypothetical protein
MNLLPRLVSAACVVVAASAASGEWKVESFKDRMTDQVTKYATLAAKAEDQGISAVLELACLPSQRLFQVKLSVPLTRGEIGANLRVDEGAVRPIFLHVFSDLHRISILGAPPFDLVGHKRFRITLLPTGGPQLFYDFDLAGVDATAKTVPCTRPRTTPR